MVTVTKKLGRVFVFVTRLLPADLLDLKKQFGFKTVGMLSCPDVLLLNECEGLKKLRFALAAIEVDALLEYRFFKVFVLFFLALLHRHKAGQRSWSSFHHSNYK